MFIRPAKDTVLRDPVSGARVPAGGRHVPESAFWLRRLRDGDAVLADPQMDPPTGSAPKPAAPIASVAKE